MRIFHLLVSGALLVAPAIGLADQQPPPEIPKENQVKIKNAHGANAEKSTLTVPERKFVEKAASDNIADIELGRLALSRTQNPAVRNFAQSLVDDHQKSLDKLKTIANDQKFPLPTSATTLTKEDYDRLSKLSGEEFDRDYLKLMEKRHSQAIDTFERAASQMQNPDLKNYADQTLPTLKEHKEKAQVDIKQLP